MKKPMTNFKQFQKENTLNVFVHHVPLHSGKCVGQLYRLFSRGCLCFCRLLIKVNVVDDSHSAGPVLCTF